MTCQEDATFAGPISLFCGIETANWKDTDFTSVAQFAKQHGISSLLIKVSEVGSGAGDLWYGGVNGIDHIKSLIEAQGVKFIPYTFPVNPGIDLVQNIQKAVNIAVQLLQRYGVVCLDIEGGPWVGSAGVTAGQAMGNALKNIPGKLWLSCPADPVTSGQQGAFQALSPAVNVWMPMTYSDNLTSVYKEQIGKINPSACIQPTLDLSQEFGANDVLANVKEVKADGSLAISLWYEGFAKQDTGLLDAVVLVFGGAPSVQPTPPQGGTNLKLNADDTVATVPFWYQLSEDEMNTCGPTTCAMAVFSVEPGGKLTATSETIDQETDAIIKDVFKISDPKQFGGVDTWGHDMYNMLVYLRDKYHKLHFLEVSTMEDLEKGIHAGYPGIFGCNEADVTAWNKSKNTWEHAYTWNLSAGHIPGVLVGIEAGTGNWLVVDPLNNRFQGYGPPYIYKRSDIAKSFTGGAIIQLTDWLQPIPKLDQWPAGFNAQNIGGATTTTQPTPTPDNKAKAFAAEWGKDTSTGIAKAAFQTYWTSTFAGGALSDEFQLIGKDGKTYTAQRVHMGIWLWDGAAHYYAYKAG